MHLDKCFAQQIDGICFRVFSLLERNVLNVRDSMHLLSFRMFSSFAYDAWKSRLGHCSIYLIWYQCIFFNQRTCDMAKFFDITTIMIIVFIHLYSWFVCLFVFLDLVSFLWDSHLYFILSHSFQMNVGFYFTSVDECILSASNPHVLKYVYSITYIWEWKLDSENISAEVQLENNVSVKMKHGGVESVEWGMRIEFILYT